jgi:hypothetical protein
MDVSGVVRQLQDREFSVADRTVDFLSEMDGLTISFPNPVKPSLLVSYSFGSAMRTELVAVPWVKQWEQSAGDVLCPVATDDRGYGVLLAGASGAFYFGYDLSLYEIAREFGDFMERLITRESWQRIEVENSYESRRPGKGGSERPNENI